MSRKQCYRLLAASATCGPIVTRCSNDATITTPGGGHYCQEHDPFRVAKEKAERKAKVVRRLEHFKISPVGHSVSEISTVEELLDVAERLEKEVKSLKKELVLHTGVLMADGSRIATS